MKQFLLIIILFFIVFIKTYSQSYIQNSTTYSWADISVTGTNVPLASSDDNGTNIAIPFTFTYFGNDYSSCYINTNGLLVFGSTSTSNSNQCFPDPIVPNNCIASYWDNLFYQTTCSPTVKWRYTTTGSTPNRIFIVSWINFRHQSGPCNFYVNSQIKLFETSNIIEVHLKSNGLTINNSGTIGIENSDGTEGFYSICNQSTSNTTAWSWTPNSGCTLPDDAGTISGTSSVCQGASGVSYSVGAITGATSYTWTYSGTGATITGTTNSVTIAFLGSATSGNLTVKGTNACGSGTVSANYPITVNPLPSASGIITGTSSVCAGTNNVNYSVTAITNATSYTWTYTGTGATITGTTNSISINFAPNATSGNLTVYGVNSCGSGTISANYPITMITIPSASGTITGTSTVCQSQSGVSYNVGAIIGATSYTWAYSGTGATITGSTNSVTIAFSGSATSGNLTVKGTNTCGDGTISANYPISVNPLPSASGVISGTSSVCQSASGVAYSVGVITGATSYTWTYSGTGATITGTTNSVTIAFSSSATSGNLTVKGTNACGDGTVSANYPISVNPLPSASGIITGTSSVCAGTNNVSYSVTAITSATSYVWTFSGTGATITGTTNSISINFATNATSGNLTVYGVNSCGSGTISANYAITVNPLPLSAGNISGTSILCAGTNNVSYTVPAITNATSYIWTFSGTGATITGTTNSITINYDINATSGNLTVTGTNACGNGAISANKSITVNTIPADAGVISGTSTVCQSQTSVSYSVPVITGAINYTWSYSGTGASIYGSANAVTINFSSTATSGNLKIKANNSCGSSAESALFPITVNPLPASASSITGTNAICAGVTSVSYSTNAINNATDYVWTYTGAGVTINGSTNNVTIDFASNATSGQLKVRGQNACGLGNISSAYSISVTSGIPATVSTISGEDTLCAGDNYTLYTVSAVPDAVSYIWSFSGIGGNFSNSTANSVLILSDDATSGVISVYCTNLCGTGAASPDFNLTINPLPENANGISGDAVICAGQTEISYSVPPALYADSYIWIYTGLGETINGNSENITIDFASNATSGQLKVKSKNACATGIYSTPFNITVCPSIPVINSNPNNLMKCPGNMATFTVSASGTALNYQWYKDGNLIVNATSSSYMFLISSVSDEGGFYCEVSNECGSVISDTALLDVNSPEIIYHPVSQTRCTGDTVTFNVTASGIGLSYQWLKNGSNITGSTFNILALNSLSSSDNANYSCKVNTACGSTVSNEATLAINQVIITTSPTNKLVCIGESATFSVVATGLNLNYQWKKDGVDILGANLSTYNIASASTNDLGLYSCFVLNTCDSVLSNSATLSLNNPIITLQPLNLLKCIGNTAQFKVTASGTGLSYQWYKDEVLISGAFSNTYNIGSVSSLYTGNYYCIVSNTCSSVSSDTVSLIINNPQITTQPISQSTCVGEDVFFTVIASGSGLSYQWKKNGVNINLQTNDTLILSPITSTSEASYTCYVNNSCSSVLSDVTTLTLNNIIVNSQPSSQNVCVGESVTFNISATGLSINYQWRKNGVDIIGETLPSITLTNLDVSNIGDYSCYMTNICDTIISSIATLNISNPVILFANGVNSSCEGYIKASVLGSISPFIYLWEGGETTDSITGTEIGTYYLTITDAYGCLANDSIEILNNPIVVSSILSSVDATCNNSCNGSAVVSGTDGLQPYNFLWDVNAGSQTYDTATNLCAGIYSVTVFDSNLCSSVSYITINEPNTLDVSVSVTNTDCAVNNGILNAFVSGGTSPYSYNWTGGLSTNPLTGVGAGYYELTVTDGNMCDTIVNVTLEYNGTPTMTLVSNNTNCFNSCDGNAIALLSGGTPPYSFSWSNSATNDTIENICSGWYFITSTDAGGCILEDSVYVEQPDSIMLSFTINDVSCFGENDGSIDLTINGGTYPYTFIWTNDSTTEDINNILAGFYTVSISDVNGCQNVDSAEVIQPNGMLISINATNTSCTANTGILEAVISGGVSPYTFEWSDGFLGNPNTGLSIGIYDATVTDANNCYQVLSDTINYDSAPQINISSNNVSCFGLCNGDAQVLISSGTSPFLINWSNGETSNSVSLLCEGSYVITVTDALGCVVEDSLMITEPDSIIISFNIQNAICYNDTNGSIEATFTGGISPYTFLWSNDSITENISGLTSDIYYLTVTDQNNCTAIDSANVGEPAMILPIISGVDTVCGISTTLNTSTYNSYQWMLNGDSIQGAVSNSYSATYTGNYSVLVSNGICFGTSDIHSLNVINVTVPVIVGSSSVCSNDSIVLSVSDVYESYQWKKNGVIISGVNNDSLYVNSAGNYTVVANIGYCSKTSANKSITVSNFPTITAQPTTQEKCIGQAAQLKVIASGTALNYQWYKDGLILSGVTSNNSSISPLAISDTGSYYCQISNICGVIYSDTIEVIIKNPQITTQPQDVLICSGDTANFNLTAIGYNNTYKWKKNSSFISGQVFDQLALFSVGTSDVANYLCVVTNTCGSVNSNTVSLSLKDISIIKQPISSSVCAEDTTSFNVICTGSDFTYQWFYNGVDILGGNTNQYSIPYVTDALAGNYYCEISNSCGTVASNTVILSLLKTNITTQPTSQWKCLGNSVNFKVTATGPSLTYQWKKDGYLITNAVSNILSLSSITQNSLGEYKCVISNSCGLSITSDTAHLRLNIPVLLSNPVSADRCIGDSVLFTVSATGNPVQFYWMKNGNPISGSTNDTLIIRNIKQSNEASYYCYIYNACSGLNSDTVDLNINKLPISFTALSDTNNNCKGSVSILVTDGTEPFTYLWNDELNHTTPFISGLCTNYYTVTVSDAIGCTNSDSVFVGNFITSILTLGQDMSINIFPNPAYDGLLNIYYQSDNKKDLNVTIFDVTGKLVNSTVIDKINSNNKMDISNLPTGIYYLKLSYENRSETYKIVIYN